MQVSIEKAAGHTMRKQGVAGNRWKQRHFDSGQVSEGPRSFAQDVFDIGVELGESRREAGLGSGWNVSQERTKRVR